MARSYMSKFADTAPDEPALTAYDKESRCHLCAGFSTAEADNADWREVARIVLHIDPTSETGACSGLLSRAI